MTPSPSTHNGNSAFRYAARQPILTTNKQVYGYELLFRSGVENYFRSDDPENASRSVIDISSLHGFNVLCDNRFAFINCTREILLGGYILVLPPKQVVVEILETVTPDDEIRQACIQLRAAGYKIALDDFILDDPRDSLADLADFIKVDLRLVSLADAAIIAARFQGKGCRLLAEKVETWEEFNFTRNAGFRLFQGYFFRKPEMMRIRRAPSNWAVYRELLLAVTRPELNLLEVEDAVKKDATLCYRLLRYSNSAAIGLRDEVRSLRHALVILGEDALRRWCRLAVVLEMTQNRPSDLLLSALVRARFSELLGPKVDHGNSDLFLFGLLSLMDSILEIPMEKVVADLPLDHAIKAVLVDQTGRLATIYKLMIAVESGAWNAVTAICNELKLAEEFVAESQGSAMGWAKETTSFG
jgi:EAL and modified HD-GYP domain-containing signal transduction protein